MKILLVTIAMMWPPKYDCFRIRRGLDLDVASQQANFAALIHVERDLAEVHVVQLLVERERIAVDGGNGSNLGPAGVVVGRGVRT
jgi:hypothetical protein